MGNVKWIPQYTHMEKVITYLNKALQIIAINKINL